jgi:ABC-type branched-subunit amino acid transport system substrate-binding protein
MISRRLLLQSSTAAAAYLVSAGWAARAAIAPGVTDAEIKIGQTMPYSGPGSAYALIGRAEAAYFKMINDNGGVNGRKILLVSVDDGYSPPKTVEMTRRLIEQDQVALIFGMFGGVTNLAVRQYLNENKVPQLFGATAADLIGDPQHYPWTMGLNPAIASEARVYAKNILATKPEAKIGVLFQDDALGKAFVTGMRGGLGAQHAGMLVGEASYEVSDPTVDSQIVTLQSSAADTLIIGATAKAAAQAIRKAFDIGWSPDRYLFNGAASIDGTLKPAGLEKAKGVITSTYGKDPSDARWKDDPGYKVWAEFVEKYMSPGDLGSLFALYGFHAASLMVEVLKQCGDDLSRENIMRQATNIRDFEFAMGLPGARVNTSPDNYYPIRQMWLMRFNGTGWDWFGDLISD